MSLSANGERSLFLRDVANIRMDMDDVERLDLTALGGIDTVTVDDMSGTDFRQADVDLSGPAGGGDGEADIVTVNGTDRSRPDRRRDRRREGRRRGLGGPRCGSPAARPRIAQVNSLGGNDDVDNEQGCCPISVTDFGLGALDRVRGSVSWSTDSSRFAPSSWFARTYARPGGAPAGRPGFGGTGVGGRHPWPVEIHRTLRSTRWRGGDDIVAAVGEDFAEPGIVVCGRARRSGSRVDPGAGRGGTSDYRHAR